MGTIQADLQELGLQSASNNDPNGHINDIALHGKVFKFLDESHCRILSE